MHDSRNYTCIITKSKGQALQVKAKLDLLTFLVLYTIPIEAKRKTLTLYHCFTTRRIAYRYSVYLFF